MTDTEDIVKQIGALYEHLGTGSIDIPLALQTVMLESFAREYVMAAGILAGC